MFACAGVTGRRGGYSRNSGSRQDGRRNDRRDEPSSHKRYRIVLLEIFDSLHLCFHKPEFIKILEITCYMFVSFF